MAVDRKQQMKEITERLEQGVKDIFTSEMYTTYLRTMAKFHNYSFNNTLLIAMQRPDATLVAGFNAWKNKFNRYVKKGEKGIQIIAPAPIKEVEEREKIDRDTGLAVLNENGEPEMERVEYVVPRFRVTTVFDVSQTDGEPIPSLEVNELTASVKDYALLTAAIEQVSPVPMRFDEIEGDAKGYYSDADKEICIQVGMGESQTIKTMIHEVRRKCQIYGSILYLGNNNDDIKCYCFGYFENGTPRIVCFHVICTDCYINLFDICIKMLGIYFSKKYSPEYI